MKPRDTQIHFTRPNGVRNAASAGNACRENGRRMVFFPNTLAERLNQAAPTRILRKAAARTSHVFNLSPGIPQAAKPDRIEAFVETVQIFE